MMQVMVATPGVDPLGRAGFAGAWRCTFEI